MVSVFNKYVFPGRIWRTAWLVTLVVLGFSCKGDVEPDIAPPGEMEREISFSIRMPSEPVAAKSRSLTGNEENFIHSLYVLSFKINTDNSEKFDYWSEASEKEGNTNGFPVQKFSVIMKARAHSQRFVLLANVGDEAKQKIERVNWEGVEKEVMLRELEESISSPDYKWNTTGTADYRPFPMWGESGAETITNTTANLTGTIPLLRMVAGIDVQVDRSVTGLTDKFKLKTIRLYNTNTIGRLVPDKDNVVEVTLNGNRNITVDAPTIPHDIEDYSERYLGPLLYEDFTVPGQMDIALRNAIYLFETASTTQHLEATCLVIGGKYGGDAQETFYRVDFPEEAGPAVGCILRNHKYTVNITDVKQRGYGDPDEAFRSIGENINVSIIKWDESEMDHIIFDDQYYYSVSPRYIEHTGKATTGNVILVKTDYPEWSYELSDRSEPGDPLANPANVNWLTVTSHSSGTKIPSDGTTENILFNVTKNEGADRTAYIHITAGRVKISVAIFQNNNDLQGLSVNPTGTISFSGETRTITAHGIFSSVDVRGRDIASDEIIDTGTIIYGQDANSTTLDIPAFDPGSGLPKVRVIAFEYYDTEMSDWKIIRTDDQRSEWFTIITTHLNFSRIAGTGETFRVEVRGKFPDIRLRSATVGSVLLESTPISAGTAENFTPSLGEIEVPGNNNARGRLVDLEYSTDGIEWVTISSGIQTTDHSVLYNGCIIARNNAGIMNWTSAMGISPTYSNKWFYLTYGDGTDHNNKSYTPDPGITTGCAGYHEAEDASDMGLWRLPYRDELSAMSWRLDLIENFTDPGPYWSSSESITTSGNLAVYYILRSSGGENGSLSKSNSFGVRCVRTPD